MTKLTVAFRSFPNAPIIFLCQNLQPFYREPQVAVAGKPVQGLHNPIIWTSVVIINERNSRSPNRDPEHSVAVEELNPVWNSLRQIVVFRMFGVFLTERPAGALSASLAVKLTALTFGQIQDRQSTCKSIINPLAPEIYIFLILAHPVYKM